MADTYPPDKQRPALLAFAEALKCRDNALRRDECGDWRIKGTHGHVYAVPGSLDRRRTPGFQIFVMAWSANGWNRARKAISTFADVTNDGDDEGALFVDYPSRRSRPRRSNPDMQPQRSAFGRLTLRFMTWRRVHSKSKPRASRARERWRLRCWP